MGGSMSDRKWWTAIVLVLLMATPAFAQVDQGRFTGTVRDATNAFVGSARVKVKNERTGEERAVLTSTDGFFLIGSLKPSTYTIRAEKDGFALIEYTGMNLAVGQELNLDFELKPAGVQEAVTVVGSAPVVDMSSARIGVNVGERDVNNLPVNGRQMSQLMLQAPGSQNTGTGTWQDVRFSGRAVEQNAIRYDGIEGSAIIDSAPGNLNGEIPTPFKLQASLENVQEFRIESNNYPAEHGTGTGGQVNVVTKSGSNVFHGSVFEYIRNDALDAPNYFDTFAGLPKSELKQNQFGGSVGGPIAKNRAFFFGSYEGYNLDAGFNVVEAVPSDRAWARAVPAVAVLRPGFMTSSAVILPGKSTNPDFDIAQLQALQKVRESSFSARFDFKMSNAWSTYVRVFHDQGTSDQPEGVSGRVVHIEDDPTNAIFNLQGVLSDKAINEFKFGYNSAKSNVVGQAPVINGIDYNYLAINLSGSVANTGIAGQGSSSGIVVPGGLVRANSATNGHAQPYDPYSLTVADTFSYVTGKHYAKLGGEYRGIRMSTDRIGGTTYSYAGLTQFLANQAGTIQYLGDLSAPSLFNNGATGPRNIVQDYFIGFAQDEWRPRTDLTINFGVRYDYYTPLTEANNLIVKWNIDTGVIDPNTTPLYSSKTGSFQPRVSFSYAPGKTVFRTGFGIFVGPGQTEDQIQPVESDRISSTISNSAYPVDPAVLIRGLHEQPEHAVLSAAGLRERVHDPGAHLPVHGLGAAGAAGSHGGNRCLCRQPGQEPVPAERGEPDHPGDHQLESRERGDRPPRVLHPDSQRRRRHHRRPEPVRRGGLQDERRVRQLQRDDAVLEQAVRDRTVAERPVHAGQELRQHRRIERGAHLRQRRTKDRRLRLRPRL